MRKLDQCKYNLIEHLMEFEKKIFLSALKGIIIKERVTKVTVIYNWFNQSDYSCKMKFWYFETLKPSFY